MLEMSNTCAPIALFAYKRLWHLTKTIDSLKANNLAINSDLYIFSDGPKGQDELNEILKIRSYINKIEGFKSVQIIERNVNYGLSNSVIAGVTFLIQKYGRTIVLEDDLILSPYALEYFNTALDTYEHNHDVMHISAYMYPIENEDANETFFLPIASCWGWATWERSWKEFDKNPNQLKKKFSKNMIKKFNLDNSYYYWDQVLLNSIGRMDSWAVFWYAAIFLSSGKCLHPRHSLVENIGNDGTGENCKIRVNFDVKVQEKAVRYFESEIEINKYITEKIMIFFNKMKVGSLRRLFFNIKIIFIEFKND